MDLLNRELSGSKDYKYIYNHAHWIVRQLKLYAVQVKDLEWLTRENIEDKARDMLKKRLVPDAYNELHLPVVQLAVAIIAVDFVKAWDSE